MPHNTFSSFTDPLDFIYMGAAIACVLCAAMAAGLTTGLLSLDTLKLRIKLVTGSAAEQAAAKKILPLLENHHFLLCNLLLFNAVANEALPIFLDAIVPSWAAVIISVTLVLLCGEILPTALFTGPHQLQIASRFTIVVHFLQLLLYPIAYPLAKLLDYTLGEAEDGDHLNRAEISAMMSILQQTPAPSRHDSAKSRSSSHRGPEAVLNPFDIEDEEGEEEQPLSLGEVKVVTGVLSLARRCVEEVLLPLSETNMLSCNQMLDAETIQAIIRVGHSRLPVFQGERERVVGVLRVKKLLSFLPPAYTGPPPRLGALPLIKPVVVGSRQSLLDVLSVLKGGQSHLALVSPLPDQLRSAMREGARPSPLCAPLGIISLEDVLEEVLGEILDEEDLERDSEDFLSASLQLRELSLRSSLPNDHLVPLQGSLVGGKIGGEETNPLLLPLLFPVGEEEEGDGERETVSRRKREREGGNEGEEEEERQRASSCHFSSRERSKEKGRKGSREKKEGERKRRHSTDSLQRLKLLRQLTKDSHNKQGVANAGCDKKGSSSAASRLTPSIVTKYLKNRYFALPNKQTSEGDLEKGGPL